LGDCSNLPTSRTAAGVMDQTPVLVENLIGFWKDKKEANHYYNGNYKLNIFKGYSSCPILISNKKVLLCEFKYNGEIDESFHPYF
jgi:sulfide:quinone oxidoreductase